MTMQEMLQSNIDYYSADPVQRRCTGKINCINICFYSPKRAGKEGKSEGCGIGRHLSPDTQEIMDGNDPDRSVAIKDIIRSYNKKSLPEWMQNMSTFFLSVIQDLHDDDKNWMSNGLSDLGKSQVDNIVMTFGLQPITLKYV